MCWKRREGYVKNGIVFTKMFLFFLGLKIGYDWILANRIVALMHFPFWLDKNEHYDLGSHVLKREKPQNERSKVPESTPGEDPPAIENSCFWFNVNEK